MSAFDTDVTAEQPDATIKYTPGVQEGIEEHPDTVDKTPPTEAEVGALNEASESTFQSPFGNDTNQGASDRPVTAFLPPGEWVSPVQKHRQRQAMLLPSFASINDLDARISAVMRFDDAPKELGTLAQQARVAVAAARDARQGAAHPDNPKYTRSVEAKDEVIQAIAEATTLVGALERAAKDAFEDWFANLTGDLDKERDATLKDLKAAHKRYSTFRSKVNAAQALAIENGAWDKSWHLSTVSESELNAPIAVLRAAIAFLESEDDFASGRFLTAAYEGVPPHTLAKLKRGADLSQPGSFAQQVYARAKSPMAQDKDAQEAISEKRLILLLNSNPMTTELMGIARDEG